MNNLTFDQLPTAVSQLQRKLDSIERLLIEQNNQPKEEGKDLLNLKEVSDFLSLSKATIYSKVSRGEIPFMKKSKRLYFSRKELLEYLKSGYSNSLQPVEVVDLLKKKGGNQ